MRFSKASWDFAIIYLLYPTVRTAAGSDVVFMRLARSISESLCKTKQRA